MGLINHLEMKNGQKVIFEKQEQNPPDKTHIRKETEKIRKKNRRKKNRRKKKRKEVRKEQKKKKRKKIRK